MPLPRSAATLAAAVLIAAAAAPARADLIGLRDGRVLEGNATKSGNKVSVKLFKGKSQTFAASEVKYVLPVARKSRQHQFRCQLVPARSGATAKRNVTGMSASRPGDGNSPDDLARST